MSVNATHVRKYNMSKTTKFKHDNIVWHLNSAYANDIIQWLKNNFPAVYQDENNILKKDTGTLVVHKDNIVLKKRTLRPNKKRWQFAFRPSQSKKTYHITQKLTALNIPIAQTLGYATEYKNGERKADYLLSSYIQGNIELRDILKGKYTAISVEETITKMANLIASFHLTNISNRDLKDSNIILNLESKELLVIDYDGISFRKNISQERAQKDIIPTFISMRSHNLNRNLFELLLSEYNKNMPASKKVPTEIIDRFN